MFAIRAERDYVIQEDFMKVREKHHILSKYSSWLVVNSTVLFLKEC
jgi:ATP-dependent 26S proteasome regulatory subunit